jgi:chromate transporter
LILIRLFFVFLRISLFAVGGAYSFLPLIEKEVVDRYHWLTKEEFLDMAGINQIFPGAISIKYATYTGYKMAGIAGVIAANLANVLAPSLVILFASICYIRYKDSPAWKGGLDTIKLVIFAMIIGAAFQVMDVSNFTRPKNILIIILSFAIFIYTRIHPAIVIILAGLAGALWR